MGEGDLASLQRSLSDMIRRTSPIAGDDTLALRAETLVVPSAHGMSPADRVDIYREQFWLRHLANLRDDYPTLAWVIGGVVPFDELATGYLLASPPRTWNLQRLGADLPAYVARCATWRDDRLASDAARLDWAFVDAFDAPDAIAFDPTLLSSTPEDAWPTAQIAFHPSLRALDLMHRVHELRDARDRIARGESAPRPPASPTNVIVWRDPGCVLRSTDVDPLAFALLSLLLAGTQLGDACEATARIDGSADAAALGPRFAAWFRAWTAAGWVSAIHFAS
jgi:putative DNA-binding protein/uncharacterized protein